MLFNKKEIVEVEKFYKKYKEPIILSILIIVAIILYINLAHYQILQEKKCMSHDFKNNYYNH